MPAPLQRPRRSGLINSIFAEPGKSDARSQQCVNAILRALEEAITKVKLAVLASS